MKICLLSLVLAAVCAAGSGCGSGNTDNEKARSPEIIAKITQQEAEAIAKKEVARLGWKGATIQRVQFEKEIWVISLERMPAMPGGHAVIKVSKNGNLVGFTPGA